MPPTIFAVPLRRDGLITTGCAELFAATRNRLVRPSNKIFGERMVAAGFGQVGMGSRSRRVMRMGFRRNRKLDARRFVTNVCQIFSQRC